MLKVLYIILSSYCQIALIHPAHESIEIPYPFAVRNYRTIILFELLSINKKNSKSKWMKEPWPLDTLNPLISSHIGKTWSFKKSKVAVKKIHADTYVDTVLTYRDMFLCTWPMVVRPSNKFRIDEKVSECRAECATHPILDRLKAIIIIYRIRGVK